MRRWLILLACAMFASANCVADEGSVYESISGVEIGRIFFSQKDRDYLDAQRRLRPESRGEQSAATGSIAATSKRPPSAGYIISSKGHSQVWKDGDFVSARGSPGSSVRFPGDIRIVRHLSAAKSAEPADDGGETKSDYSEEKVAEPPAK